MLFTLTFILQAQPQQKVSWLLWAVGAFFFLAGLALLIILMRKRKHLGVEDEPEFKKLITHDAAVDTSAYQTQPLTDEAPEISASDISEPQTEPDVLASLSKNFPDRPEELEEQPFETKSEVFSAPEAAQNFAEPTAIAPADEVVEEKVEEKTAEKVEERIYRPPATEERIFRPAADVPSIREEATFKVSSTPAVKEELPTPEMLSEAPPLPAIEEPSVGEDRWEELPVEEKQTSTLASSPEAFAARPADDSATKPLVSLMDEDRSARVEQAITQQNFEQPITKPNREPFEPPRIEPLVPQTEQPPTTTFAPSRQTKVSTPLPSRETRLNREPIAPFANEPSQLPPESVTASPSGMVTSRVAEPVWQAPQSGRKVAGAVLGLPVETSDAPLVIGKPVISEDEIGVTGFTNYGKAPDASDTGRGGLIALVLVLVLVGGGVAAYFKVPAFHAGVDSLLSRIRTGNAAPEPAVEKPKAQIIPSRNPEVNKNIVKAKGAVLNISEETLEELSVEISFYRAEKVIESRIIAVTPNILAPNQQGAYEFEYDGSKSNGFALYSVTKLISKNGDVKFTSAKH